MNFGRYAHLIIVLAISLAATASGQAPVQTAPATATAPAATMPSAATARAEISPATAPAAAASATIGSLDPKGQYEFQVELTSQGAAVESLRLARFFTKVEDTRLFEKLGNEQEYQKAVAANPGKYQGHYQLMGPTTDGVVYLPLETRSLRIEIDGRALSYDCKRVRWEVLPQELSKEGVQSVSMRATFWSADRKLAQVTKTYSVHPGDYTLYMTLTVDNLSGSPIRVGIDQAGPSGLSEDISQRDYLAAHWGRYNAADDVVTVLAKPAKEAGSMAPGVYQTVGWTRKEDDAGGANPVVWIGMANKFFGSMMYLQSPTPDRLAAVEYKGMFYEAAAKEATGQSTYITGVDLRQVPVGAGEKAILNFQIFAGPKQRDMLGGEGTYGKEIYQKLNYLGILDIGKGGCAICTWSWLIFGMMKLLVFLAGTVAFGNYGVAIILLVVLVRIALHPLTKKGQVSMMKMSKMGPMMAKLKEKYADDKEALNREMMAMYKQHGATPILGCLPMILQMPIWIALYTACNMSVELRHAAFLPFWLTDLAAPDAVIKFAHPLVVPLLGWHLYGLNLLPLLLTVATILQAKLTPQSSPPGSPEAARQQKMMMYMMPIMMLLFFYSMPSGLTLYVMASTFAGVAEQWVIRKHIREREAAEAAGETTVQVPGKGPRFSRPKKPKGPNWFKG